MGAQDHFATGDWLRVLKGLLLRYGGVGLYRKAMPLFLGLILGQMIVGSLWHLVGLALGVAPYSFWGG